METGSLHTVAAIRSGGFRSSGGYRSSSSSSSRSSPSKSSSSSKSGTSKSTTKTSPSRPANYGTSTKKAGDTIKVGGKTIKTSTKKPTNSIYKNQAGVVGDNGYTPRFTNGYSAPAGSVVYYPQHSFVDYLPWVYLFSLGGDSPQDDKVTTVQPDGKQVVAEPVQEGVDGLAVFNWILLVVIVIAAIGGIVYGVNKLTSEGA